MNMKILHNDFLVFLNNEKGTMIIIFINQY